MNKKLFFPVLFAMLFQPAIQAASGSPATTDIFYLSGTDKDHTATWDFFCTDGAKSGYWTTIEVPSCWELQGFGGYNYGHDRNPHQEQGLYRKHFTLPGNWNNRRIFIVFEGVMTDATVKINGIPAGPTHQGAFYRFKYDITSLVKKGGDNLLEVQVKKESDNPSINGAERRADYWIFGGIFRPVYLEAQPEQFIDRVAIDARHTGAIQADLFIDPGMGRTGNLTANLTVYDASGQEIAVSPSVSIPSDSTRIRMDVADAAPWSSESPTLYTAVFSLSDGEKPLHTYSQRFGFRTIEFKECDGFYVNDVKIKFKGVCRHTFWPESGRTSSKALAIEDVNLIREMNMNAVRMSHYPPDQYFLDVCDSLGLYVIDELAGWQSAYDGPTSRRLAADMIRRDVNHPCIVIWANGNEGGFPVEARSVYGQEDIQKRHVVEPWSRYDGTDTHHYPRYSPARERIARGDIVYMPTESLHGLHDGGHGAGLQDYWDMIRTMPTAAGQFLWNFADEGIVRHDLRDSIDVFNDKAPDGILGPHHEKEGSFYAIREIWSPVHVSAPDFHVFDGTFQVSNRYHFTNLKDCCFRASLIRFSDILDPKAPVAISDIPVTSPDIAPWTENARLRIQLPEDWRDADVLALSVSDRAGKEICAWAWSITDAKDYAERMIPKGRRPAFRVKENDNDLIVTGQGTSFRFNKHTGILKQVSRNEEAIAFPEGPRFVGIKAEPVSISHKKIQDGYRLQMDYSGDQYIRWTISADGWLRLDYAYVLDGDFDVAGITFDYPETDIREACLFANGPYRTWKNRPQGGCFGIHEKKYNDTVTGQSWDYPEFKGYYSLFSALKLFGSRGPVLTMINATENRYLHLFTPARPIHMSRNVNPAFPDGQLSVLNCIPAIGTKFSRAEEEGPSGQANHFDNQRIEGTLYLYINDTNLQ